MVDPNAAIWFLGDGAIYWGPYSIEDFRLMSIPPHALVWTPGWPRWVPFGQVFPTTGPTLPYATDPRFGGRGWPQGSPASPPGQPRFGGRGWPKTR